MWHFFEKPPKTETVPKIDGFKTETEIVKPPVLNRVLNQNFDFYFGFGFGFGFGWPPN